MPIKKIYAQSFFYRRQTARVEMKLVYGRVDECRRTARVKLAWRMQADSARLFSCAENEFPARLFFCAENEFLQFIFLQMEFAFYFVN
jgi:hypothetical protein